VTGLLIEWNGGDKAALEQLMPLVYKELHVIAHRHLRNESKEITLQTTALVHEAYLKLVDQTRAEWRNRMQFYGVAANIMRRILIDYARKKLRNKRGGGVPKISLEDGILDISDERAPALIALDEALTRLAEIEPEKARIVELRYFGGLEVKEIAELLGISTSTVNRQWRLVRAWLYREIVNN
jgi:RNA polymerase sigma factor (TIGR02999 family)